MQNTIQLSKSGNQWVGEYFGPCRAEIIELFGASVLPTAFTASAPADEVLKRISELNPAVKVVLV